MPDEKAEEIAAKAAEDAGKEGEKPEVETEKEAAPTDPMEVAARADGWRPKGEYKGDPGKWVDAKTWVEKGPLLKRISSQSEHIKELKSTVDAMAKHFNATVEATVKAKIAALRTEKKAAIESGDVAKVEEIDSQIDEQKAIKVDIPTGKEVAPVVKDWVKDNEWFIKDPELHDFALAFNDAYLKRHPGDIDGCLRATGEATKRAFPEKFPAAKKEADDPAPGRKPSAVEGSTTPSGGGKKFSLSRLTQEQKRAHDQYIKAGTFDKIAAAAKMTPTEYYVKQLDEIGELSR
jgi:hypothetical protein